MARIFISYRRADSEGAAGRLGDHLRRSLLARNTIVRDLDSIQPGEDFEHWIDRELSRCDCFLIVIGPRWMELMAERLRSEQEGKGRDQLRYEIVRALAHCRENPRKRIIPILVQGAVQPSREELARLSPELAALSVHQYVNLHPETFGRDAGDLSRSLSSGTLRLAVLPVPLALAAALLVWRYHQPVAPPVDPPRSKVTVNDQAPPDAGAAQRPIEEETRPAVVIEKPHQDPIKGRKGKVGGLKGTSLANTGTTNTVDRPPPEAAWRKYFPGTRACTPRLTVDGPQWWLQCDCPAGLEHSRATAVAEATLPENDALWLQAARRLGSPFNWRCP